MAAERARTVRPDRSTEPFHRAAPPSRSRWSPPSKGRAFRANPGDTAPTVSRSCSRIRLPSTDRGYGGDLRPGRPRDSGHHRADRTSVAETWTHEAAAPRDRTSDMAKLAAVASSSAYPWERFARIGGTTPTIASPVGMSPGRGGVGGPRCGPTGTVDRHVLDGSRPGGWRPHHRPPDDRVLRGSSVPRPEIH